MGAWVLRRQVKKGQAAVILTWAVGLAWADALEGSFFKGGRKATSPPDTHHSKGTLLEYCVYFVSFLLFPYMWETRSQCPGAHHWDAASLTGIGLAPKL